MGFFHGKTTFSKSPLRSIFNDYYYVVYRYYVVVAVVVIIIRLQLTNIYLQRSYRYTSSISIGSETAPKNVLLLLIIIIVYVESTKGAACRVVLDDAQNDKITRTTQRQYPTAATTTTTTTSNTRFMGDIYIYRFQRRNSPGSYNVLL